MAHHFVTKTTDAKPRMMGFRRDAACCAAHERATTKRSDRLYSELGTHDTEFLRVRIVALPKADKHTRRIRRY